VIGLRGVGWWSLGLGLLFWYILGWGFMVFFFLGVIVIIVEDRHFSFNIGIDIDLGGLDFILFKCDSSEYFFHLIMGNNFLPCISKQIPIPVLQLLLMIFMIVSLSRFVYLRRARTLLIGIW
jgi:hypothetical protein